MSKHGRRESESASERREHTRIHLSTEVEVSGIGELSKATLRDLSFGGARIFCGEVEITSGKEVELLVPHQSGEAIRVVGEVLRSRDVVNGQEVGVRFVTVEPSKRQALRRLTERVNILNEILAAKRRELKEALERVSAAELEKKLKDAPTPRGLKDALRCPRGEPLRVIAEIKRASPSAGPIRLDADPASVAREYEASGAAAISVLTDSMFFEGSLRFLPAVREAVSIPLLRKDFLLDPYQVLEARVAGADGVLLIVAALDDEQLEILLEQTHRLGMEALVEVHSEEEAHRAVRAGADLLGVNHRDLATFKVDRGLTARLRPQLPAGSVVVAESGIRGPADLAAMRDAGADAVLVGESLMRAESPGAALTALLEGA